MDVQTPTSVDPLPVSAPTLTPSTIVTITLTLQAPTPLKITPSTLLQDLPSFGSLFGFDHRLKKLEANFSEFTQKNQHRMPLLLISLRWNLRRFLSRGNKSIHRSNEQRNLYKALVEAYEFDKIILNTYKDTVTLKRCHDDDSDKDDNPSLDQTEGPRDEEKERSLKEPMKTTFKMEEPSHPEFETGADDQPIVEPSQHLEWFSQQNKPPTPDCDWNKTLPATNGRIQPWISELAKQSDSLSSFNKMMDTPRSCKSLVELEFFLEEVYKAMTDQLDWVNPKGQQYPHNLLKALPLILNSQGHRVIPFDYFINNDLEYLRGGASSHKYTTSVTKTKAADYRHIK
nr:hypothetical protein [Tanacetum cinerariifolium]